MTPPDERICSDCGLPFDAERTDPRTTCPACRTMARMDSTDYCAACEECPTDPEVGALRTTPPHRDRWPDVLAIAVVVLAFAFMAVTLIARLQQVRADTLQRTVQIATARAEFAEARWADARDALAARLDREDGPLPRLPGTEVLR